MESRIQGEGWKAFLLDQEAKALVAELKQCGTKKDLKRGKPLHSKVVHVDCFDNVYVANTLVTMYSKCACMQSAHLVFETMSQRNVISYTALIVGYVENGESLSALNLFSCMDCAPNCVSFLAVVKACAELATTNNLDKETCLEKGASIHRHARALGFDREVFFASTLVEMYGKCGDIAQARLVFDGMVKRDVVTWTALIVGYVENEQCSEALNVFKNMDCAPNALALAAALKACGGLETKARSLQTGIELHGRAKVFGLEKSLVVANTLIDIYGKCGDKQRACLVFDEMTRRDVVSWTALLAGYVGNGENSIAFDVFNTMDCVPNRVTFVVR